MLKGIFLALIIGVLIFVGFAYLTPGPLLKVSSGQIAKRISFETVDGLTIKGSLYIPAGTGPYPVFILSHQNYGSRAQFDFLIPWLLDNGFAALAYDTRGFGKSDGDQLDYNHAPYDVTAAIDYLEGVDQIDAEKIYGIGASLGANVVYVATAYDPRLRFGLILSPSVHALDSLKAVNATDKPRNITIVATELDEYSSPTPLLDYAADPKRLIMFKGNHHGIELLKGVRKDELFDLLLKLK